MVNYNWIFPYVPQSEIESVFELGSRDCEDAVVLGEHFRCPVVAFECNPQGIQKCKAVIERNKHVKITLVESAVADSNGSATFYPFDTTKYDNDGASSLFEIDFVTSRPRTDADYGKNDVQTITTVQTMRLDTFLETSGLPAPDLLVMDIQESELLALKGLGDAINKVKYVVFEGSLRPTYKGGCSFYDCHAYLISKGFTFVSERSGLHYVPLPTQFYSATDALYKRTS